MEFANVSSQLSPFDLLCYVRRLRSQRRGCVHEREQLRHLYDIFSAALHHVIGDVPIETSLVSEVIKSPSVQQTSSVGLSTAELNARTATINDIEQLLSGLTFPEVKPQVKPVLEKEVEIQEEAVVEERTDEPSEPVEISKTTIHESKTDAPKDHGMVLSASPIASVMADPSLFSLESGEQKPKVTKSAFRQRQSQLEQGDKLLNTSSSSADPLSGLDPLWKLRSDSASTN